MSRERSIPPPPAHSERRDRTETGGPVVAAHGGGSQPAAGGPGGGRDGGSAGACRSSQGSAQAGVCHTRAARSYGRLATAFLGYWGGAGRRGALLHRRVPVPAPAARGSGTQICGVAARTHQLSGHSLGLAGWPVSHVLGSGTRRQAHALAAAAGCAARQRDSRNRRRVCPILVAGQQLHRVFRRQVVEEGANQRGHARDRLRRRSHAWRRRLEPQRRHPVGTQPGGWTLPGLREWRKAAARPEAGFLEIRAFLSLAAVPAR